MVTDHDAIKELQSVSDITEPHIVQHYMYFPEEADSNKVATQLESLGFEVENRISADGVNWLVLAKCQIVPNEPNIARLREQMESFVTKYFGEYDGWEAELPHT